MREVYTTDHAIGDVKFIWIVALLAVVTLFLTVIFTVFMNKAFAPLDDKTEDVPESLANHSIAESTAGFLLNRNASDIETLEVDGELYVRNPNIETICFIGNDKKRHIPSEGLNGQADAIFVVAIDRLTGRASIINIPRDSMVDTLRTYNGSNIIYDTKYQQICLAYSYGTTDAISSRNVCRCVSDLLEKIPVDYYFSTQEDFIANIVDAMGSIEITPIESIPGTPIEKDHPIQMDGELASQYVLWRDIEHYKTALDRNARQRQFLGKLVASFMELAKEDPERASEIIEEMMNDSSTDIPLQNVLHLAQRFIVANGVAINGDDQDSSEKKGAVLSIYTLEGNAVHNSDSKWEQFLVDKDATKKLVAEVFYTKSDEM